MRRNTVFTSDGRLNSKANRLQEYKKALSRNPAPVSYSSNETKEELCMEYVKSFMDQFKQAYPKRKLPYMIAENECGVRKFVCSTLKPTQLQFSELYDMHECAVFLASYMLYEPLDPQTEPPAVLPSPGQSLNWHTGDSFDMAMLLCSLLLGSGYDAYVVYGYAPKHITLHDQTQTQCPLISKISSQAPQKSHDIGADGGPETDDNPYVPPNNEVRTSKYLEQQKEKKRQEGLDSFVLWCSDERDPPVPDSGSTDTTRRVHAWVLVRAGMREVEEHTFLEPSTGRAYPTTSSPYIGIESLWNKSNYWVNVNVDVAPSAVSSVSFVTKFK